MLKGDTAIYLLAGSVETINLEDSCYNFPHKVLKFDFEFVEFEFDSFQTKNNYCITICIFVIIDLIIKSFSSYKFITNYCHTILWFIKPIETSPLPGTNSTMVQRYVLVTKRLTSSADTSKTIT
jgi:hypothetical protein